MIYLIFFLLILAICLYWVSMRFEKALGLPGSKVIYSDTNQWASTNEPLFDDQSGLTGKPDYLIEVGNAIIPVEVKSTTHIHQPYDSHIFQLAAYCRLVEHTMKIKPPYGILHYTTSKSTNTPPTGRSYAIPFIPQLSDRLDQILKEMRLSTNKNTINRSHQSRRRCQSCGFYNICDQRIQ
jgi:CRISPR-associated exonuclease Cas4